ncbi:hypothetical protein CONLIGDRAFT_589852 [Coniochaeta ligniaria NRRL 30616]|uniref:Zn(2)-C6 fungal-type domain-containing protein n=1 Tax=Coniochaeta ligniaria NRRL 30616 TaxID=1408157 RepID=A0A1J7JZY2_9PEZI|nr:hypothetical protein CONLIGDRAFT_589852 [Coniochaeta ligniaria NRRL 30616]
MESIEPQTPASSVTSARLRRSTQACQRCRRRKQKCDLRYPKCSTCESAHASCLTYDIEKQTEIPRGYISLLEDQVRELKLQVEELKKTQAANVVTHSPSQTTMAGRVAEASPVAASTLDSATSDPEEMVRSMGLVLLESSNQPRFMGTSSGVTFAKMVLAAIKHDPLAASYGTEGQLRRLSKTSVPSTAQPTSLPPRHAAEHIARVYFSYRTSHVPVLERSKAQQVVDRVYGAWESSGNTLSAIPEYDLFVANMIFAVGLHGMPIAGGGRPSQSEGCFHSALKCAERLLAYSPSDLETLTVVLLLGQYIALNPSQGSLWQLTGIALRLAVDLGLHWETSHVLALPRPLLNQRRRLYWAIYRLDRFLTITLGRPFGIAELSMNTGYPDPHVSEEVQAPADVANIDIFNQRCANHIVKLYRLESEIKHVLYHQLQGSSQLAYPRANYGLWYRDILSRLRGWRDEVPTSSGSDHQESIYSLESWWEAHHCSAMLLLHRPNPLVSSPTTESLQTCFDMSRRSIQSIKTLQREGRISIIWAWVHHLFLSGLTMIYCLWESADVRTVASIVDVMTASQDCASTLTALTERFADAGGCRDAFERLSSTTMKWLINRDESAGAEAAQLPPALGSEFDALKNPVPFSSAAWQANGITSLFTGEPFDFAQYLSMAAEWEDYTGSEDIFSSFLEGNH